MGVCNRWREVIKWIKTDSFRDRVTERKERIRTEIIEKEQKMKERLSKIQRDKEKINNVNG